MEKAVRIVVWLLFPLGQVLTCHLCPGIHGIYSCTSAGTSGCVRLIKPVHVREIRVFSCDVRIVGWDVRPIRMPRIRDRNGKTCPHVPTSSQPGYKTETARVAPTIKPGGTLIQKRTRTHPVFTQDVPTSSQPGYKTVTARRVAPTIKPGGTLIQKRTRTHSVFTQDETSSGIEALTSGPPTSSWHRIGQSLSDLGTGFLVWALTVTVLVLFYGLRKLVKLMLTKCCPELNISNLHLLSPSSNISTDTPQQHRQADVPQHDQQQQAAQPGQQQQAAQPGQQQQAAQPGQQQQQAAQPGQQQQAAQPGQQQQAAQPGQQQQQAAQPGQQQEAAQPGQQQQATQPGQQQQAAQPGQQQQQAAQPGQQQQQQAAQPGQQQQVPRTLPQYSPPTTRAKTAKKQLKFESMS